MLVTRQQLKTSAILAISATASASAAPYPNASPPVNPFSASAHLIPTCFRFTLHPKVPVPPQLPSGNHCNLLPTSHHRRPLSPITRQYGPVTTDCPPVITDCPPVIINCQCQHWLPISDVGGSPPATDHPYSLIARDHWQPVITFCQ